MCRVKYELTRLHAPHPNSSLYFASIRVHSRFVFNLWLRFLLSQSQGADCPNTVRMAATGSPLGMNSWAMYPV